MGFIYVAPNTTFCPDTKQNRREFERLKAQLIQAKGFPSKLQAQIAKENKLLRRLSNFLPGYEPDRTHLAVAPSKGQQPNPQTTAVPSLKDGSSRAELDRSPTTSPPICPRQCEVNSLPLGLERLGSNNRQTKPIASQIAVVDRPTR